MKSLNLPTTLPQVIEKLLSISIILVFSVRTHLNNVQQSHLHLSENLGIQNLSIRYCAMQPEVKSSETHVKISQKMSTIITFQIFIFCKYSTLQPRYLKLCNSAYPSKNTQNSSTRTTVPGTNVHSTVTKNIQSLFGKLHILFTNIK